MYGPTSRKQSIPQPPRLSDKRNGSSARRPILIPTLREILLNITVQEATADFDNVMEQNPDVGHPRFRKIFIAVENSRQNSNSFYLVCNPEYFDYAKNVVSALVPFLITHWPNSVLEYLSEDTIFSPKPTSTGTKPPENPSVSPVKNRTTPPRCNTSA